MKKITLLAVAFVFAITAQAQTTLTQSVDPVTVDDSGVACWDNVGGTYSENSFFRAYDLADFGVTGDFELSSVEYGQGSADDGKIITLNIYTADDTDLTVATLTGPIATATHTSASADDLSLISESISGTIPAGSIVVFEVNAGDSGGNTGETYFPGGNAAGENALSYLAAVDCGITSPTPVGDVAAAEFYVMNVIGDEVALGVNDNLSDVISIYPNPAVNELSVNIPSSIEINSVVLYDVLGKDTGARLTNGTMDLSNVASGVYILNIVTSEGTLSEKVVKR